MRWLIVSRVLALLVLLAGGIWFYRDQEKQLRNDAEKQLHTIAQLKVEQIAAWRGERLAAATALMANPYLVESVERWLAEPQADAQDAEALHVWLRSQQESYGYRDVSLVDPDGTIRLSLEDRSEPYADEVIDALSAAWHDRRAVISALHLDTDNGTPHIGVVAPLFKNDETSTEPVGALIIRSDATEFLNPLMQSWPVPSASAESLLVKRDGDSAVYLTDLRHEPDAAVRLRTPLNQANTLAVMAVQGQEGVTEGEDYRGVDVLAALYPIPDSTWHLVAKVDSSEIFAVWHTRATLITVAVLGLGALIVYTGLASWFSAQKHRYQALFKAEQARRAIEARAKTILLSIGDGVITTDSEGRVELINPVAEALTGWSHQDARGKPLEEIFRIANEETHQTVENPVRRVMHEGAVVGLANHTLLLSKDGREIPIADSAAPIWDANHQLDGVVLVFRDQSEERAAHQALQESEAYIRTVLDNLPIGVAVNPTTPPVVFSYTNDNFVKFYRTTREAIADPDSFWESVYEDAEFREVIQKRVLEDTASGDPARMKWEDVPLTRQGDDTTYITAQDIPIPGKNLLLSMVWDTTERKRAEDALRESELRYRSLFEKNNAVMLLIDPETGMIVNTNAAASAYYGWTHDELCQMAINDINMHSSEEAASIMRQARSGERSRFLLKHRQADGTIRDVEVYTGPINIRGQDLVYEIVHDITDRVRAEKENKLNETRLRSLLRIAQHDTDTIQELLDFALKEAIGLTDSNIGYIYHYDEENQRFILNTWSEEVLGACRIIKPETEYELERTGIWGEVVRQRKPIVVNDFQAPNPLRKGYPEGHVELHKYVSVPVFKGEQIVAVVGVANKETDYTSTDVWQLSLLMDSVWKIVGRKRVEEALQASEERYRQLAELAPVAIYINRDDRIDYINPTGVALFGASTADEVIGKTPFDLYHPDSHDAIRERARQVWEEHLTTLPAERKVLRPDGEVRDVEAIVSSFNDQNGSAILVVANDITERKRAQAAEHEQRVLAEVLRDTAAALISLLDLESVMNTILGNVATIVPYDAANVMLIEDGQAEVVHHRGYHADLIPQLQEFRMTVAETQNLRHMIMTGIPFLMPYTEQASEWVPQPTSEWVKSYVGVPIRMQGNVIGFLNLDSATPGHFNERHAERLQAFADLMSIAIEHAQLYEQVQRYTDELEQRVIERTAELNHAKERTEAIFNSSSDVMILFRTDGTISQVNPAFTSVFKCEPDAPINQHFTRLVIPEHIELMEEAFAAVKESRQPERLEITVHCPTGKTFDADVALSPIVELEGHLLGVVCNLRDITLRKRMEAQLRQTLEQEIELNELKTRYVSMAAHDLRNPLAVIQSAFTLLEHYGDRLNEEQKQEKFDSMRDSVEHMVDLLDDILVIGQAESGRLTFSPDQVDLNALCQELAAEAQLAANTRQHIEYSCAGECSDVFLDAKLLRHILGNLLSNAIKYSPDGSTIGFSVMCEPDQVLLRVQDQGIGIPDHDQEQLFQAFHRGANVGGTPGTGLGLAIVKQSVDLHGGAVAYESEEGAGATFTVTLPQAPQTNRVSK